MGKALEKQQQALDFLVKKLGHKYSRDDLLGFMASGGIGLNTFEWKKTYKTKPVSIEQFLDDEYYIGALKARLWDENRKAVIAIVEGKYPECVLTGAIGIGKTTVAQLVNLYYLYLVSLMKNPHNTFGLMMKGNIVFVMLNKTASLAKDVTYQGFRDVVAQSPYFAKEYPFDSHVKSEMVFPRNVKVIYAAAYDKSILGMDVIGGIIDELNKMAKVQKSKRSATGMEFDQAKIIYDETNRRIKSRFLQFGQVPACLCSVGSADHEGDFTDLRKQEIRNGKEHVYIWDKAQWEVVPKERFSGKSFYMDIGNAWKEPRFLTNKESKKYHHVLYDELPEPILRIPVEYKPDFEKDIYGAMRDLAGLYSHAKIPFFYNKPAIQKVFDSKLNQGISNIFTSDYVIAGNLPSFKEEIDILDLEKPRRAHLDLSKSNDSAGFAMGFIKEFYQIPDESGKLIELPVVYYDCFLEIKPVNGKDIDYGVLRELIYMLSDIGYNIECVSYDQFQSVDSQQILRKKGYKTKQLSVEGEAAYLDFREAIHDQRIYAPKHNKVITEINNVQHFKEDKRVDHTAAGSKDVLDSMVAVYKSLKIGLLAASPAAKSMIIQGNQLKADREVDPLLKGRVTNRLGQVPKSVKGVEIVNPKGIY